MITPEDASFIAGVVREAIAEVLPWTQRRRPTVQCQTPASAVAIDPAALDPGDRYDFRDKDRVLAYLAEHSDFVDILRQAAPEIAKRFGPTTRITLEVYDDPEGIEDESLWGLIGTSLPPMKALDRLHRFDAEYWIERSAGINESLALNLRFIP